MIRVRLWAPESDYDQDAVVTIAKGIKQLYSLDIEICGSSKSAFHDAIHKDSKDGLRKATENYLKMDQFVLFLLDLDGAQSIAQRRCESNSLVSQIERVSSVNSRVKLIFMDKELEAWFLVDVLGVCCFYNRKNGKPTRTDKRWVTFAKRNQSGKTENIFEPVLGGKGVKEHLVRLSREILKAINPRQTQKAISANSYSETDSEQLAPYIEISKHTIGRNESLKNFATVLQRYAVT